MAKSILLLIERRAGSKGPAIPIRNECRTVSVSGLADGDLVALEYDNVDRAFMVRENGTHSLPLRLQPGMVVRAELLGDNSVATVWVE